MSWLDVKGAAKHLSVSKETIYRLLDRGEIPSHRIGKLWRFSSEELDLWMLLGSKDRESKRLRGGR